MFAVSATATVGLVTADVRLCDVGDTGHSCARCRMTDDTKLPGNIVRTPATTNDPSCLIASFSAHILISTADLSFANGEATIFLEPIFYLILWKNLFFQASFWGCHMGPPLLPAIYCARRIACESANSPSLPFLHSSCTPHG